MLKIQQYTKKKCKSCTLVDFRQLYRKTLKRLHIFFFTFCFQYNIIESISISFLNDVKQGFLCVLVFTRKFIFVNMEFCQLKEYNLLYKHIGHCTYITYFLLSMYITYKARFSFFLFYLIEHIKVNTYSYNSKQN